MASPQQTGFETAANAGFEAKLWAAADALRNNMDAAEYKHVVLGLNLLKCISDGEPLSNSLRRNESRYEMSEQRSKRSEARVFTFMLPIGNNCLH